MPGKELFVLVGAIALVGIVAAAYSFFRSDPPQVEAPPFFYQLDAGDIVLISMTFGAENVSFAWDEADEVWRFDDSTREEPDPERWGGMPVLLAGPRIQRELPAGLDLGQLGLSPPRTTIDIGLENGTRFRVLVGGTTPSGSAHYVMQDQTENVLLVDAAWANVIERLVTDPPRQ